MVEMARFMAKKLEQNSSVGYKQIAKSYTENLSSAAGGEAITERYVEFALKINDSFMTNSKIRLVVMALEEEYGQDSPFNSLERMKAIFDKVKDSTLLQWVMACIEDAYRSGAYGTHHALSANMLTGGAGGKGDIDVWLMKFKLREHLLGSFMEKHPFNTVAKTQLRQVFSSHKKYRELLKPCNKGEKPDLSWQSGWGESSIKLMGFIEERLENGAGIA